MCLHYFRPSDPHFWRVQKKYWYVYVSSGAETFANRRSSASYVDWCSFRLITNDLGVELMRICEFQKEYWPEIGKSI